MDTHPSFLELDRAALGQGAPLTADHVKGCPRCQAHLKTLEEPIAVPAWATALRRPQPERKPSWWALVLLGAAAAAGATAVFLFSPTRPHPHDLATPTVGTLVAAKGSPSVAIYLLRDERISLWDGHTPIQPGDRIELQVSGEGLDHVLVATPGGFARPLFSADIDPKQQVLLPQSWLVDDSPGAEGLVVVMSASQLSADEASAAVAVHRRDARVWTTELTLPKAPKAPQAPESTK
jgi:hypothetical protein